MSDFDGCVHTAHCENNVFVGNNTTEYNQTNNCSNITEQCKIKKNTFDIKKNVNLNKKQKNISFSNEKLWEINRVNQILHNKVSNGVKPTYSRQNPSFFVKATSKINREKKQKDIEKSNKILANKLKNVTSTI
ncbi:Hypothetical protein CINCED_3A018130 [Cinara cedri]|uniref:Uncharacterized protein n=1 Tax=Cinara cedri TaxID=506608 RepID=A0A5E4M3K9_9HEMI|nr:Hypothetical protein CINCED_3A018130 [Cinara cedri]